MMFSSRFVDSPVTQRTDVNTFLAVARYAEADGCLEDFIGGFFFDGWKPEKPEVYHAQIVLHRLAQLRGYDIQIGQSDG